MKTQKSYRSKLRQQVAENYPQKFKGNVDDPDFASLPAPVKLCVKTIESIKDFRVSSIVTIMEHKIIIKMQRIIPNFVDMGNKEMRIEIAMNL